MANTMSNKTPPHTNTQSESDVICRFYFENQPFRGAVVKLQNSFIEALNGHDYPEIINALLGEALAATTLMGVQLKHSARISLQARGDGLIQLLLAEANIQLANEQSPTDLGHGIRAVARLKNTADTAGNVNQPHDYLDLLGHGQLAITIEPEEGERYQGIVAADQHNLKACLESYFNQSEQIPTFFMFASDHSHATGILLQRMPHEDSYALDARDKFTNDPKADALWQELTTLADTLSEEELIALPAEDMLYRLFHQHQVKLSPAQSVRFQCSCSYQRTSAALAHINPLELEQILSEDGEIVMDCEFCSARYRFNRDNIAQLGLAADPTRH